MTDYYTQLVVEEFLKSECENSYCMKTANSELYKAFTKFVQRKFKTPCTISLIAFGRELSRVGIKSERTSTARYRVGIVLLNQEVEIDTKEAE